MLEVKIRNREELDQRYNSFIWERETIIIEDKWSRGLEQEDSGILTVLGMYQREREKERKKSAMKEFLVGVWRKWHSPGI